MKRWHEDKPRAERQRRLFLAVAPDNLRRQTGKFRKLKAFDCGKPRCRICHWNKLVRRPRLIECKADRDFREGLAELQAPTKD